MCKRCPRCFDVIAANRAMCPRCVYLVDLLDKSARALIEKGLIGLEQSGGVGEGGF